VTRADVKLTITQSSQSWRPGVGALAAVSVKYPVVSLAVVKIASTKTQRPALVALALATLATVAPVIPPTPNETAPPSQSAESLTRAVI
jgi:hypothetical protein